MPPLKYFFPNAFTGISLMIGLGSIVQSVHANYELAAWMILWASLLDRADGLVARLLKATSQFGVEFDSFADFVAFGIAPAALIYFRLSNDSPTFAATVAGNFGTALGIACAWYALALAIRLARFNISCDAGDRTFLGLPGTLLGTLVAAGFLTWSSQQWAPIWLDYAPVYLAIGGFLMISNVRIPKLKPRKNRLLNLFQFANIVAVHVLGILRLFPEYLFGLAATYAIGGIGWCLLHREANGCDEETQSGSAPQTAASTASVDLRVR